MALEQVQSWKDEGHVPTGLLSEPELEAMVVKAPVAEAVDAPIEETDFTGEDVEVLDL